MVQAWDFVDAHVLWQHGPAAEALRIDEIFLLDTRILNACRNHYRLEPINGKFQQVSHPLVTLKDLATCTEAELMRMPNLGRRSVNRIKQVLARHGLSLAL